MTRAAAPALQSVDRKYNSWLRAQGYGTLPRQLLASITPIAAAALLSHRDGLERLRRHVDSAGTALTKLNISPDAVAAALNQYNSLLEAAMDGAGSELPNFLLEWLHATILLNVSAANHQVREAESKAFLDIFQIDLEADEPETLFARVLEVLSSTCGAAEARLFLLSEDVPGNTPVAAPLYIRKGTRQERYLLDPEWRGVYPCYWSIPLLNGATLMGVIQFGFSEDRRWLPREEELLTQAAHWCVRAARKVWLVKDLAAREEEIRRLGERMLEFEELERRRISRELHDDPGQSLVVIRLHLELMELAIPPEDEGLREKLAEVRTITEKTILDIRRLISDLSPAILEQLGLAAALRQMVNRLRRSHSARIRLKIGKLFNISKNLELITYRLIQESCNDILKHSLAKNVNICLTSAEGVLRLHVEDYAAGLKSPKETAEKQPFRLPGIRERVALLGGKFDLQESVISNRSNLRSKKYGIRLEIELPVQSKK